MKNHFLVPIVWLCLGLPATVGYAQEQAGSKPISLPTASAYLEEQAGPEPIKSKGGSKFYNAAEGTPMQVRAKVGKAANEATSLSTEEGKGR